MARNGDGSVTITDFEVRYTNMFHPRTRAHWHIAQAVSDAFRRGIRPLRLCDYPIIPWRLFRCSLDGIKVIIRQYYMLASGLVSRVLLFGGSHTQVAGCPLPLAFLAVRWTFQFHPGHAASEAIGWL